jgi:hypothetical protein
MDGSTAVSKGFLPLHLIKATLPRAHPLRRIDVHIIYIFTEREININMNTVIDGVFIKSYHSRNVNIYNQ